MLTEEAMQKFIREYEKTFGELISRADALRKATNLINLYRAVLVGTRTEAEGD